MEEGPYNTSPSESGTVALLVALYNADHRLNLTELGEVLPNFYSLRNRIAQFDTEGLAVQSLEMDPRKVVYISLTEKGKKVASVLVDVVKFLPDSEDLMDKSICMRYAEPVLVMLFRNGKMNHNDILNVFPNYIPIVKKLFPALEKDGLVKLGKETTGRKPNTIELTTLGRMIATGLDEAHKLIKAE